LDKNPSEDIRVTFPYMACYLGEERVFCLFEF